MPKAVQKKSSAIEKKEGGVKKAIKKSAATTKSAPIKSTKVTPSAVIEKDYTSPVEKQAVDRKSVKVHKSTIIIAGIIILLGALLYFGRSFIVAAVVNGQPISRLAVIQETEKVSGKQVISSLIRNTLVEQEASKKNVTVSDKEINDQIKTIEDNLTKQGQKLDQMLELEGMTRDDLHKIIRLDILVTKLVGKDIKIADKDIENYLKENKDLLPKGKNEKELKEYAADQLKKAQLPQKAQTWFAELEKKAQIVKFVDY